MATKKQKKENNPSLFDQIKQGILEKTPEELKGYLNDLYPQDLAPVLEKLKDEEKIFCFTLLTPENAGHVLSELSSDLQKLLLKKIGPENFGIIVSKMDDDDASAFIRDLSEEEKSALLKVLPDPILQAHVQELIHYPTETAGAKMSTDFLSLRSDMTIDSAFEYLRKQLMSYKGQILYVYIVDSTNKLVGVINLRALISAPAKSFISEHMNPDVITAKVMDDQESAAKTISKYDLLALPVIDETNNLKGIITIDDVVDILNKETTEDIYQSHGISDESQSDKLISGRVTYAVKARLPWLLITLLGEALAAIIIASFDKTIISAPIAISFMPLLSGLSGNVGGQTATIIVRGLVTGEVDLKNTVKHVFHELKIGMLIGIICGLITGLIAWNQHHMQILGLVVGAALCCSVIAAAMLGVIFPILLQYLKKDPACASSPAITTLLDIIIFTFYLVVVSVSLQHLR